MMVDIRTLLGRRAQPQPPQPPSAGKQYWRSLDQLHDTPEFRSWMQNEFPAAAEELETAGPSRRKMLQLMAASFGLAGMVACRRPEQYIMPFAKGSEGYVHGKPVMYATAMTLAGVSTGLMVEVNDGRPTKVEGNPDHPGSLGAALNFHQAAILGLYDPDRSHAVLRSNQESKWDDFAAWAKPHFGGAGTGEKVRFLTERFNSPSFDALKAAASAKWPQAKWIEWEPVANDAAIEGAVIAFGQPLAPLYHFEKADTVLSLDSDFLGLDSVTPQPIKGYARRRKIQGEAAELNRLYVVESQHSVTGANADHRLRMRSSEVAGFTADLAGALGVAPTLRVLQNDGSKRAKWIAALVKELNGAKGKSLVVAGPRQPAAVHALAYAINQALGNVGTTVTFIKAGDKFTPQVAALKELVADINSGKVDTLVVLGGNPVYTAPADLDFEAAYKKVANTIHLGLERDETAVASTWHVPMAHAFESWGDGRAIDGTVAIQQPLIEPLFGGKTPAEIVALASGYKDQKAYDIVRNHWLGQLPGARKEVEWRKALHGGVVPSTAAAEVKATADARKALASINAHTDTSDFEVVFVPSFTAWDGRFVNNGWLQEAAEPMTKITWDNAALVSPATAKNLGLEMGDIVSLERQGRKLEIPVFILPGHADMSVTVALGYGRKHVGRVGTGVGFNAYTLRTSDALGFASGFRVAKTGANHVLATTVDHHPINADVKDSVEHRILSIVREGTVEEYKKNPHFASEEGEGKKEENLQLYPVIDYSKGHQWGMAIDLNSCIGCNACVLACQAENNTPIVGKEQVIRGREMHWIRLDRYYVGPVDEPQVVAQPMACQQCENAPCENVCPVAATSHSAEGLNDMAYNRCVGTRYCANNCPYKVRRFNFFNYHLNTPETVKMVFNPDVTVRMRGVMEKCTYCVQRIQETKIAAKVDGRRAIKDGEITPACAQTCPAEAITFGDINDPNSRVAKLRASERGYAVLGDLNVKPRTTYLAKLRNPNPELENHG